MITLATKKSLPTGSQPSSYDDAVENIEESVNVFVALAADTLKAGDETGAATIQEYAISNLNISYCLRELKIEHDHTHNMLQLLLEHHGVSVPKKSNQNK
jgi:hypothetical protein